MSSANAGSDTNGSDVNGGDVNYYFGTQWDAQMFDEGTWVQMETPVGRTCQTCREVIRPEDRGQFIGSVVTLSTGSEAASIDPVHALCLIQTVSGHNYGVCSCTGYRPGARARAALLERINLERQVAGQGPWEQYQPPAGGGFRHLRIVP